MLVHLLLSECVAQVTLLDKIVDTVISTLSISSEEQTVELGSKDSDTANSVLSQLEEMSGLKLAIYTIFHFKYVLC